MNEYEIRPFEWRTEHMIKNEKAYIGKTIKSIEILGECKDVDGDVVHNDDDRLVMRFTDGSNLLVILQSDCCALVYFATPDNLNALNGEVFKGFITKKLPDESEADDGVKEAAILEICSDKDSIQIYHYNEHNGYYSGTDYWLFDAVQEKLK